VAKFYAASNAVCGHIKFASNMSVLFLLETFCLPLLSYCCEVLVGPIRGAIKKLSV